jgi:hypothetical protein
LDKFLLELSFRGVSIERAHLDVALKLAPKGLKLATDGVPPNPGAYHVTRAELGYTGDRADRS